MTGLELFMTKLELFMTKPHVAGTFYDYFEVGLELFMTRTGEELYVVKLNSTYGTFYDFRQPELFMTNYPVKNLSSNHSEKCPAIGFPLLL